MKIRRDEKILLAIGIGSILLGALAFQFRMYSGALFCGGVLTAIIIALCAATSKRRTEFVVDERVTKIKDDEVIIFAPALTFLEIFLL